MKGFLRHTSERMLLWLPLPKEANPPFGELAYSHGSGYPSNSCSSAALFSVWPDNANIGIYQLTQFKLHSHRTFATYTEMVKFFEQAIDWQLMSYLFYPYYWADKCDWADLMSRENDDPIFQAFLQSGMARVVVPIRLSFSEAFALYLDTGDITIGTTIGSDNYLSIVEELQTIEGTLEDTWETRVPTTLAIIQGKSAYLEEEGLPCCHEDEGNNITPSENILGNILAPSTPE